MSTTDSMRPTPQRGRPAERALFVRLVDDAAVFPPGNAPLPDALRDHRGRAAGASADLIGPLLVPASAAGPLHALVTGDGTAGPTAQDISVGLIARPGTPVGDLQIALSILRGTPGLRLYGVELAHAPGWTEALAWDLPLAVEVSRDASLTAALDELAATSDEAVSVVAKLRTQGTAQAPVPTAAELAAFIRGCVDVGLPFKLTGGLHHAVAQPVTQPDGSVEEQHGVVNVLWATHLAASGAEEAAVLHALESRDGPGLAEELAALDGDQVAALRGWFVSFGCCGVMDPITDVIELGLLPDLTLT